MELIVTAQNGVMTLKLNRPEVYNSFNTGDVGKSNGILG